MCCLFGLMDYKGSLSAYEKSRIINVLARACEVRGIDATGIAYNSAGSLHIYKRPLPAHKLRFRIPDDTKVVMGHTRMTTQGSEKKNRNNHPFHGNAGQMAFALAHNGILHNDRELRHSLSLPKTRIQTDSYVAVQLLEQKKTLDLNSLKDMAEQVEGSFVFAVLDEQNRLYFVKGENPMCIYRYPRTGLILYASTETILKTALRTLNLPLEPPEELRLNWGETCCIAPDGSVEHGTFQVRHTPFLWRPYVFPQVEPDRGYVQSLMDMAGIFGHTRQDVAQMLEDGLMPEEIEEYFYCGVF